MRPLRPHVLALTRTTALALTGCAATTTSPPPSPTPHTPHTITPPSGPVWPYAEATEPPQMQRIDSAGACAFAEYALRFIPEDLTKGRSQRLEEHSSKDCEICSDWITSIRYTRQGLLWSRGNEVRQATLTRSDELQDYSSGWACDFSVDIGPGESRGIDDPSTERIPALTGAASVYVQHEEEGWKLIDIRYGDEDE